MPTAPVSLFEIEFDYRFVFFANSYWTKAGFAFRWSLSLSCRNEMVREGGAVIGDD